MIASGVPTNGSAQKTASRTRSEVTTNFLRDMRSTNGPATRPTMTDGTMVTMNRALTHHPESCVRSLMSTVSAISASHVPMPEPSVAKKSSRKLR